MKRWAAAALVAAALCSCQPNDAEDAPPARKVFSFTGQVDKRYAGHWATADKMSELDMNPDGTVHIVAVSQGPGGKSTRQLEGQWKIDGKDLLLQYPSGGGQVVVKSAVSLSGSRMTLIQAGNNRKSVYGQVK